MNTEDHLRIPLAPELETTAWLNVAQPLSLGALRGQVVMLHAFQMLCPGCVSHGLPQASAVHEQFGGNGLTVIGLHTMFEHHDVMGQEALKAFVHEYRLRFPIAIDQPSSEGPVPRTMSVYGLQGTPSVVLIDRQGAVRLNHFGRLGDLALGAMLGQLLCDTNRVAVNPPAGAAATDGCSSDACAVGTETR